MPTPFHFYSRSFTLTALTCYKGMVVISVLVVMEKHGSLYACEPDLNNSIAYELSSPAVVFDKQEMKVVRLGDKSFVEPWYDNRMKEYLSVGWQNEADNLVLADLPKDLYILNRFYRGEIGVVRELFGQYYS